MTSNKEILIDKNLPSAVIFDVDGTLSLKCDRDIYDGSKAIDDYLNKSVYALYHIARSGNRKIIICTGRDGRYENVTKDWLAKHDINYDAFYIRKTGDSRCDAVVKREFLEDIVKTYNPILSVDDRDVVVNMWRESGIDTLQVDNGILK